MKKQFVSGLIILALAAAVAGFGCKTTGKGTGLSFNPGTYEGTAQGFGGPITAVVTVNADSIVSIEFKDHSETPVISDPAFEKLPKEIIQYQTAGVDAVSGCTNSSNGILGAVKAALLAAGASEAAVTRAPGTQVSAGGTIKKTADVVIIGAGGAGMSAAVEIINAGGSVILIDKRPAVGGNTLLAGSAMNAADPERQKSITMSREEMARIEAILAEKPQNDMMKSWQDTLAREIQAYKASGANYLFDSPSLHKLQTYMDGDYVGNAELINIYGDKALDSVNFLTDLGAKWIPQIQAAVGATWKRSHTPTTDLGTRGASFVLPQANYVASKGGEVMLDSRAESLVMSGGRCTGVKGTTNSGQAFEITARKGVIIAAGGFGANIEMRQKYNKHWPTLDESVQTTNGPQATGDGIVMAEKAGANLVGMEWIQLIPTYGPGVFTPYIENQMYVNLNGDRFVAEDGRRDVLSKAALEQPGAKFYILSDANTVVNGMTSTGTNVDERVGNGYIYKAAALEDLARQMNVPLANLQASIRQFNQSVRNGNDPLGRSVFDKEFGTPPFYAGITSPMVHHTMGGIEINGKAQVIDTKGKIIPGLYAAGETTGGIHGSNRLGGNAITDVVTFGRIAGRSSME
ncbi:FAD-dependent oxidoreductase [Breznakiella homolactica]|uniref:FAD-dependent oxidoreductase n=1 Tax=Breznakiella homolactica TaxID=2798577 RepID=A0A7T8BAU8_9SPIR|nr:FAD-dependent oxidoreductase [Breznakiella homolactica]QQO09872.1 FAD-dependent oxidoreductase [Breznakiella homolactica]